MIMKIIERGVRGCERIPGIKSYMRYNDVICMNMYSGARAYFFADRGDMVVFEKEAEDKEEEDDEFNQ